MRAGDAPSFGRTDVAKLTLQDAEDIAQRGRPWTIRLEFVGSNPANQSGQSAKYWYATGRGLTESVEVGYGALGAKPVLDLIDWNELRGRVADKIAKGYDYAHTPFVRMSAESLAKLAGTPVVQVPVAKATPVTTPAGAPIPPPPQAITHTVQATQAALPHPHNLLCVVRLHRTGIKVDGYEGLDKDGDVLVNFGVQEGLDFARQHGLDILFA